MADLTQEAQRLLRMIRYQVFTRAGSTVGDCERGCGNRARCSGVCAECLVDDLRKLLPESETWRPARYLQACWEQYNIERRIMEIVEVVR